MPGFAAFFLNFPIRSECRIKFPWHRYPEYLDKLGRRIACCAPNRVLKTRDPPEQGSPCLS